MGLDLVNIARTGIARSGIARLNAGEVEYTADGSIVVSGSAYVQADSYVAAMSGGILSAGVALLAASFSPPAAGSISSAGAVPGIPEYAPLASGEIITDGTSETSLDYLASASGSVIADGTSVPSIEYNLMPSGEASVSGTVGWPLIGFQFETGGAAAVSGESTQIVDYTPTDLFQGGLILSGDAVYIFRIDVKGLPVFIRRLDGDVRVALNQDGGFIRIRGGQPEMDDGLETAVNISLFSQSDYWGNALADDGEDVGSTFSDALSVPLSNQARLDVIEAARSALSWLTSTGIASAVEVSATIPSAGRLDLGIIIRQPEKAPAAFRYTVNWQSQKIIMQEAA